jgi:hypothetical protein
MARRAPEEDSGLVFGRGATFFETSRNVSRAGRTSLRAIEAGGRPRCVAQSAASWLRRRHPASRCGPRSWRRDDLASPRKPTSSTSNVSGTGIVPRRGSTSRGDRQAQGIEPVMRTAAPVTARLRAGSSAERPGGRVLPNRAPPGTAGVPPASSRQWAEGPAFLEGRRERSRASAYRQCTGPAVVPKQAGGNAAYTLPAITLTHLRKSPKLKATG